MKIKQSKSKRYLTIIFDKDSFIKHDFKNNTGYFEEFPKQPNKQKKVFNSVVFHFDLVYKPKLTKEEFYS